MSLSRTPLLTTTLVCATAAMASAARAGDRVTLEDGRQLQGIVSVAGDEVVVSGTYGSTRVPRKQVARIALGVAADPAPPRRVERAPEPDEAGASAPSERETERLSPPPAGEGHAQVVDANVVDGLRARIAALAARVADADAARVAPAAPAARPRRQPRRHRIVLGIPTRGRTVGRVVYRESPYRDRCDCGRRRCDRRHRR